MTACASAVALIEGLNEANAAESLSKLRGLSSELGHLYSAIERGDHSDAFEVVE